MNGPTVVKPIPAQVVNEGAAYGPFNLHDFIQNSDGDSAELRFRCELVGGQALPKGMICTSDGIISGIPAKGTQGNYEILLTVENQAGSAQVKFILTIKPTLATTAGTERGDQIKSQIWEALGHDLPIPELGGLYNQAILPSDVYYLLERWAVLTIWDAFNLDHAGEKHVLQLEGASTHYDVYDRGSCLVANPKNLYSHERTLEDALQTARAMGREVYKRRWTIEFAGFEKMVRAAWVEIQHQGNLHGSKLEILHFNPTDKELHIYNQEARKIAVKKTTERF
jgi:hypothetical protein